MVEQALSDLRSELIDTGAGKGMDIYGEGEKWPTYEAFIDWLIAQASNIEDEENALTMAGDFTMTSTATQSCTICAPPSFSGTIDLVINLETCEVSGTFTGDGAGITTTTCVYEEEEREYTATGTASFSGDLSGSADQSGILSLDSSTVMFEYSWNFVDEGNEGGDSGQANMDMTFSGQIDWSGSADGTIQINAPSECSIIGDWSVNAD